MDKYFDGSRVLKEKVAMDIKYRELDRAGIDELLSIPGIEKYLVGTEYKKKVSKDKWSADYLDSLSYAAATECFNKDYLYYLDEVATYVAKQNKKRVLLYVGTFAFVIIIIIAIAMRFCGK